jgi:AraC-like DNA-binding protein
VPDLPPANAEAPTVAADVPDPADERLAQTLQRAMDEERAYRDEGLSVASLATRLGAPEYRLRRLINQRLGHRNFNAFVNGYRLAEARAALLDPRRSELPVLSIALDAGFQSIGPFNRAFKATTGLTPTEFRRGKLADS